MVNIIYSGEPSPLSRLGIKQNIIAEIEDFVDAETALNMIQYFEANEISWQDIAFYNSSGMGLLDYDPRLQDYRLDLDFFQKLRHRLKETSELVFGRKLKPNTCHAQKWVPGGFANPHSDNSDEHGVPNAFEINKYVSILYLNDDYEGGELYFPEHGVEFKPKAMSLVLFPGGVENIHGVRKITKNQRYTMVSFWDFEESEYSQEKMLLWEKELDTVRQRQANQKAMWDSGRTK